MVAERMAQLGTSVINRCFESWAEEKAAYRLMSNEKLKMEDMTERIVRSSASRCRELSHVLCLQDTCEFRYDSNSGRLSEHDRDLGYGTNRHENFCIYAHPGLIVDAASRMPVGFSSLNIYNHDRTADRTKSRRKGALRLEEKESFRWAESAVSASLALPENVRKTMVGDRESDIYTVMCRILESGCDFLIRSRHDRKVGDGPVSVSRHMDSVAPSYGYDLPLHGHRGRRPRTARMRLRFSEVSIRKSPKVRDEAPESIRCWCIVAEEDPSSVPDGEKPVEWRLLTSHEVEPVEQAVRCVEWYKCRWFIEELFRVCKTDGFCAESARLERGARLKKLLVLTFFTALRCMTLKRAYDEADEGMPCSRMFMKEEVDVLKLEMDRLHRASPKSKDGNNPFREESLPWAAWIVARLGGWCAYPKAFGRPGYITLKIGLDRFLSRCEILFYYWNTEKERDVYKE